MQPQKPSTDTQGTILQLTPEDVKRLLIPSNDEEREQGRFNVAGKVASTYGGGEFNPQEAVIAEQIFRLLVRDTEVKVRAMLAGHLKASAMLPRDIVLTMARDVEEVALPMLKYSEVLSDEDLLQLLAASDSTAREIAISERKNVTEIVSDALIAKEKPEVASSLLRNPGAKIDELAMKKIVSRFAQNEQVMQSVTSRSGLPLTISEKLVTAVSHSLTDTLREKHKLPEPQLVKEEEKTREASTLALLKHNPGPAETEKLVNQLRAFNRLTPALVLEALAQGYVLFFELSMARLTSVPLENVRKLINDRGDLGFRALYNKSGLPGPLFTAVRALLRVVYVMAETEETRPGPAFVKRAFQHFESTATEVPEEQKEQLMILLKPVVEVAA